MMLFHKIAARRRGHARPAKEERIILTQAVALQRGVRLVGKDQLEFPARQATTKPRRPAQRQPEANHQKSTKKDGRNF